MATERVVIVIETLLFDLPGQDRGSDRDLRPVTQQDIRSGHKLINVTQVVICSKWGLMIKSLNWAFFHKHTDGYRAVGEAPDGRRGKSSWDQGYFGVSCHIMLLSFFGETPESCFHKPSRRLKNLLNLIMRNLNADSHRESRVKCACSPRAYVCVKSIG